MPNIPLPGEGRRGPDGHVVYLLRQASHALRLRLERDLAATGLTAPQFSVMTMIGAYPGCSGADLARLTLLTPQTVSFIVGRLLDAGLAERGRAPDHGRIRPLALSDEGRQALEAARRRVEVVEAEMVAGLSPEEEATIRHWLARLARENPNDENGGE